MPSTEEVKAVAAAERAVSSMSAKVSKSSGSTTVGPFVVKYSMNTESAHVEASVKLAGLKAKLFSATLTRAKNSASAGAKAVVVKASLRVTADFDKMALTAAGTFCIKRLKGLKFKWKCKTVSARVA